METANYRCPKIAAAIHGVNFRLALYQKVFGMDAVKLSNHWQNRHKRKEAKRLLNKI